MDQGLAEPTRRTSGRVRVAPDFFVSDPIPQKKKTKKKVAKKPVGNEVATASSTNGITDSKKSVSKPSKRTPVKVPEPKLDLIYSDQPVELVWLRIHIREFLLRFESCFVLSPRHAATVFDPVTPWNEYIYKSIIMVLLGLIYDKESVRYASDNPMSSEENRKEALDYASPYRESIANCSPESERLWLYVEEFCQSIESYTDNGNGKEDESGEEEEGEEVAYQNGQTNGRAKSYGKSVGEHEKELQRLELLNRLLLLAVSSTKLRLVIAAGQERQRKLQMETSEKIRESKARWEAKTAKLDQQQPQNQAWRDRYAKAKHDHQKLQFSLERNLYFETNLKTNIRTTPVGTDYLGNSYWIFQQHVKELRNDSETGNVNGTPTPSAPGWGTGWVVIDKNPKLEVPTSPTVIVQKVEPKEDLSGPKRRKKKVKLGINQNTSLYYTSGKSNIQQLASWVRANQNDPVLAKELEKYAKYI